MSLVDAVRSCLRQYVGFSGRARRSEFWWWQLFVVVGLVALAAVESLLWENLVVTTLAVFALWLPSLAVLVRRLHDTDRSGWWVLLGVVPLVGGIVLLVFEVMAGDPQNNRYGPSPKTSHALGTATA